MEPMH